MVTNGSMQADAFLFEALVEPGDLVIVDGRRTIARCCRCAPAAPTCAWSSSRPTGSTWRPLERVLAPARSPSSRTSSPTSRTPRAARCRSPSASAARAGAQHGFTVFEDDPYAALRFEGAPLPTMLSMDGDTVVYASSFSKTVCPGIRVGYLVGPAELIARIAKLATSTYISPSMVSQAIVHRFCRSGAIDDRSRPSRRRSASAPRRSRGALESSPTRGSSSRRAATSYGSTCRRARRRRAVRGRGRAWRAVRQGLGLRARGRRRSLRLAYSGVTPEEIEEGVGRLAEAYRDVSAGVQAADAA